MRAQFVLIIGEEFGFGAACALGLRPSVRCLALGQIGEVAGVLGFELRARKDAQIGDGGLERALGIEPGRSSWRFERPG